MMLHWKVDIMAALREKGYIPNRMRSEKLFGEATIQNMRYQKPVSWSGIETLCRVLEKQPGDLLEYVPDETNDD